MKWVLPLLLLLPWTALAQTNTGLPTPVQSCSNGTDTQGSTTCQFPDAVTSGNLFFGYITWNQNGPLNVTFQDTCTSTITQTTPVTQTSGLNKTYWVAFYGTFACSGTDMFSTVQGTLANIAITEFTNVTGTLDGSVQQTTSVGSPSTVGTSITTTINGDLIVGCISGSTFGGFGTGANAASALITMTTPQVATVGIGNGNGDTACGFINTGAHGSYTFTSSTNDNTTFTQTVAAFKPVASGITIVQNVLPIGGNSVAYNSGPLYAVGGTGTYTWSTTAGLPGWASIDGATGKITGTPNAVATSSVTVQVTDGTSTTTKSLSLPIITALGTPALRYSTTSADQHVWTTNVYPNDLIVLKAQMLQSGQGRGWQIEPTNLFSDTLGLTWYRFQQIAGGKTAGLLVYVAQVGSVACGSDTITFNKQGGESPVGVSVEVWASSQAFIDAGAITGIANGATSVSLASPTLTTYAPSSALDTFASAFDNPSTTNATISSPFTNKYITGLSTIYFYTQAHASLVNQAVGTYTSTLTASGMGDGINQLSYINLFALRPGTPSLACAALNAIGEKIRRRIF